MARRNQSTFKDLFEIAAMVPWWVGVVLAVVSYLLMHQVATMANVYPANGKGAGEFVGRQLFITFAMYLQYILPVIFLSGAAASKIKKRKRAGFHLRIAGAGTRKSLEQMSWREFEQLVGEYFRRKGFSVTETGGGGADGGVDLVITREKDRYFVQCKQWKARQVGVAPVRELFGVMAANGAVGGYVVTSGVFTAEAKRFAEGREIELIAGDQLAQLIQEQAPNVAERAVAPASQAPLCPKCAEHMVLRTARKGSNTGSDFWGCSRFPNCRGTRPA